MSNHKHQTKTAWNKGKLIGQKLPLKLSEIYAIRVRLQLEGNISDLTLFNLAIDSKLRGCDLVKLKVRDISHGSNISNRGMVTQQKTMQPVKFEITQQTKEAVSNWIWEKRLGLNDYLFPSRIRKEPYISTQQFN